MKKLTVLLIVLIISNCLSICPFAYEATDDEKAAIACALNYLNTYYVNVYFNNDDLLIHTIDHLDDNIDLRKEILEKAKEYEDEIRKYHYYYFEDKNITDKSVYEQEDHSYYGCDPAKDSLALQYDSTPIEDVISSFPVFIKKSAQYYAAYNRYHNFQSGSGLYLTTPESVTVSESGFAYINFGDCVRFLLYKYKPANQVEEYGGWIICDFFNNGDGYARKYRFNSESMDVEKELLAAGITPISESESTNTNVSNSEGGDHASADENDNKVDASPQKSEPANYIPWVICTAEGVAIIALVIALILKKKK